MLASLVFVLFCALDWTLLLALPYLGLSFAPEFVMPLGASLFVRSALFGSLSALALLSRWRKRRRLAKRRGHSALGLFLVINLGFTLVQLEAYAVEPLLVRTTELSLAFDDLDPAVPPVRVVHLTDTHIERNSFREASVVRQVSALHPDIVVLTGDYLNLSYLSDPVAAEHFRILVGQIEAPYGIYAVRGTVEGTSESMARLLEGTGVVWLEQESLTIDVRGQAVTLVGVASTSHYKLDAARLAQALEGVPPGAFTLLLYHSPDLILEAVDHGIDLYLGGHTHGGQIRLPFYGPIVTFSRYGRRYAAGLFREEGTIMYISRGLGFEGGGMPRARFFCPPEIVSLEIGGR